MKQNITNKIKHIKLLILDVDGILTNGEIIVDAKGEETKIFNVQDGFGLVLFKRARLKTAILSARSTEAVTHRAKDLQMDKICQDAFPKLNVYKKMIKDLKVNDEEVCFMADDLTDIAVLKRVGFAVTVPNAVKEVKAQVDYVTKNEGGRGAVREVVELILKAQKKWTTILKEYS